MKKVLFGITSLTLGGAERVLIDIANKLCNEYSITIFTIYPNGELEKELSNKVKLKTLYNKQYSELSIIQKKFIPLKVLFNKKGIYKKYIKEDFDVEIAFLEGPVTRLISVKNSKTRKIAWIHNDISRVFGSGIKATIKRKIDEKIYSKFENLVFVSKENMQNFNETYEKLKNVKKQVIYNYINKENVIEKAKQPAEIKFDKNNINFVTVARLVEQKAIDRFIKVHAKLINNGYAHNVYIIGDGPERKNLEKLIEENNVEKTFHLLGKKENPYSYIKQADYFCLLSEFEGYGMVLEEAKILAKPIIITKTAAIEAAQNYKDSIILENSERKIYDGLKQVIQNFERKSLENVQEYDNSQIIQEIKNLVGE